MIRGDAQRLPTATSVEPEVERKLSSAAVAEKLFVNTQSYSLGTGGVDPERVSPSDAAAMCSAIRSKWAWEAHRAVRGMDNQGLDDLVRWLVLRASEWAAAGRWRIRKGDLRTLARLAVDEHRNPRDLTETYKAARFERSRQQWNDVWRARYELVYRYLGRLVDEAEGDIWYGQDG